MSPERTPTVETAHRFIPLPSRGKQYVNIGKGERGGRGRERGREGRREGKREGAGEGKEGTKEGRKEGRKKEGRKGGKGREGDGGREREGERKVKREGESLTFTCFFQSYTESKLSHVLVTSTFLTFLFKVIFLLQFFSFCIQHNVAALRFSFHL